MHLTRLTISHVGNKKRSGLLSEWVAASWAAWQAQAKAIGVEAAWGCCLVLMGANWATGQPKRRERWLAREKKARATWVGTLGRWKQAHSVIWGRVRVREEWGCATRFAGFFFLFFFIITCCWARLTVWSWVNSSFD